MTDLKERFADATAAARTIDAQPSNEALLTLYACYKQATLGDVQGSRPGLLDPRGRAKFDAWKVVAGTSENEAMQRYIAQVDALL